MEVKFKIDVTTEWDLSQIVEMGDDYVTLSSEAFGYTRDEPYKADVSRDDALVLRALHAAWKKKGELGATGAKQLPISTIQPLFPPETEPGHIPDDDEEPKWSGQPGWREMMQAIPWGTDELHSHPEWDYSQWCDGIIARFGSAAAPLLPALFIECQMRHDAEIKVILDEQEAVEEEQYWAVFAHEHDEENDDEAEAVA